jgi:hypothetical protein
VSLIHWVGRGTGTPKDKDEVNKREVCECEGLGLSICWEESIYEHILTYVGSIEHMDIF